jgi:serine/threonine protein phosphatase PrpC
MLHTGVRQANGALYERNQQQPAMMGTTVTAALVFGRRAHIVSVGDSRAYLYRPATGMRQITRDHSLVAALVEAGLITPDEIYTHPKRNELTRCLGNTAEIEIDSFTVPLHIGDRLLLCSDGLWEMVRDSDLSQLMANSANAELFIQAALNRGGDDNVSVIVVTVGPAA